MPHSITLEMGLPLYELARSLEGSVGQEAYTDLRALAQRIEERALPESFLHQWDAFMDTYGFRGPNELDIAAPRYADDSRVVLEQMRQYVLLDEAKQESPQQADERRQRERREAYHGLLGETRNPLTAWLVQRLYRTAERFSGFREIHKYQLVRAGYQVGRRALEVGEELAEHGQLNSAEQVFDLTYEDLADSSTAWGPDLRERGRCNTCYRRRLQQLPSARFPVVVDSRGHIPHPARLTVGPGVLIGQGVSPGSTIGPAKVLSRVGDKPVLPGQVLGARAARPWLDAAVRSCGRDRPRIGRQFGAVVAREYGRPCLVGIENATERISDGQLVELDGTAGTLTILSTSDTQEAGGIERRDQDASQ